MTLWCKRNVYIIINGIITVIVIVNNAYFILPIIFVNFVYIKRDLFRYVQQNFASFCPLRFAR